MREVTRARGVRAGALPDTPERILRAALEAFSEKGFEGARTRDIALRANVTLGLLQYHFGNKDKLWKSAVDRAFADLQSGLEAVLANPSGSDDRELLRLVLRAHVRFVAEHTEFIRIMHDEGKRRGPRMRWLVDRYVKPLHDKLTPLIASAQRMGALPRGIAPTHFVYIIVGAVGMLFHQSEECKRVSGIDPADPAVIEAHARAVEMLFLGDPDVDQQ